jgi:hypothetical protein
MIDIVAVKERARRIDPLAYETLLVDLGPTFKRRIEQRREAAMKLARIELAEEVGPTDADVKFVEKPRHYSFDDIERMRTAIRGNPALEGTRTNPFTDSRNREADAVEIREALLRTYMANGTTVEELEEAKRLEWVRISERKAERKAKRLEQIEEAEKTAAVFPFTSFASRGRWSRGGGTVPRETDLSITDELMCGVPLSEHWRRIVQSRVASVLTRILR